VTRYQAVEDYLPDVFAGALGGERAKAEAIFDVVHNRGLESKLKIISAAFVGADDRLRTRWDNLRPRVSKAAEARNQIAHASPTHYGGMIRVTLSNDPLIPPEATRVEDARMELRKRTREGEKVWTTEDMRAEYDRADKLFQNLIAFVKELRGEKVPPHLLAE
jgi:hypothetical protein